MSVTVPDLDDGGRWDGEIVAAGTYRTDWRGVPIEAHVRQFDDGAQHITVAAPDSPPPYAPELLAELLHGDEWDPWIAAVLADEWGLDLEVDQ